MILAVDTFVGQGVAVGPNRIEGVAVLDGQPVRRRIDIRRRVSGDYIRSTCTQDDGAFLFKRLPPQTLADPYTVTCYDDSPDSPANAMIFDRVYQVDDDGNKPQT